MPNMLLTCPNCQSSYRIDAASVGGAGRTVRCTRCQTAWFAEPVRQMVEVDDGEVMWMADASGDGDEAPPHDDGAERFSVPAEGPARRGPMDIESAARRRPDTPAVVSERARPASRRRKRPFSAIRAVAYVGAMTVAALGIARADVVRMFPETAALYGAVGLDVNVRGLQLAEVAASERIDGGVPVLLVAGAIENVTRRPVDVPRIRLSVRNAEGRELYVWTAVPQRQRLVAGESMTFQTQLAAPPAEARDVVVRFLAARDAVAGLR